MFKSGPKIKKKRSAVIIKEIVKKIFRQFDKMLFYLFALFALVQAEMSQIVQRIDSQRPFAAWVRISLPLSSLLRCKTRELSL